MTCPLYWCPCWHMTEHHAVGRHGTFWRFPQRHIFEVTDGNRYQEAMTKALGALLECLERLQYQSKEQILIMYGDALAIAEVAERAGGDTCAQQFPRTGSISAWIG